MINIESLLHELEFFLATLLNPCVHLIEYENFIRIKLHCVFLLESTCSVTICD